MIYSKTDQAHLRLETVLNQQGQTWPAGERRTFVENQFKKGQSFIDTLGKPVSPVFVLDRQAVKDRAYAFRAAFEMRLSHTGFYYAVKSNNCPDISEILIQQGFGLDVSSGEELSMALGLGAVDMVFSGPGKTNDELDLAVRNSDKVTLLIDSPGELCRVAAIAARQGRTIRTGVRLNADPRGLWRKFGIPLEDLGPFVRETRKHANIQFNGLQFHTSWNMGPEKQVAFLSELGRYLSALPRADQRLITFIDIGGGYWPEDGEWIHASATPRGRLLSALSMDGPEPGPCITRAESIAVFAEDLSRAIADHIHSLIPCRICFEPGRWISHDAMHILLRVQDRKYPDLVITDGGTNMIGWERFETDYFPVLNLTRPAMDEKPCLILGSLCTPHDVWGYSYWGEDIRDGDLLMIPCQGAYTYSLRQNFIKPLPGVLKV